MLGARSLAAFKPVFYIGTLHANRIARITERNQCLRQVAEKAKQTVSSLTHKVT